MTDNSADRRRTERSKAVLDWFRRQGGLTAREAQQRVWLAGIATTDLVSGPITADYRRCENIPARQVSRFNRRKLPAKRRFAVCSSGTARVWTRWTYRGWDWMVGRLLVWVSDLPTLYYSPDSGCTTDMEPPERWLDGDADPEDPEYDAANGGVWRTEVACWDVLGPHAVARILWGDTLMSHM